MKQLIDKIKKEIEVGFEDGGYKLNSSHIENGKNLHSEQFYYAKRVFQNTANCDEIADLLSLKLRELKLNDSTTLIGFRNYTGLLLNKLIERVTNCNYAVIEQDGPNFIWQHQPDLYEKIVIVLPITCTCSAYLLLRRFIEEYIKESCKTLPVKPKVDDNFINIFLILDKSIENMTSPCEINSLQLVNENLFAIYSSFNWIKITENVINFKIKTNDHTYFGHPLIRLYSNIYLPERCELCFPLKDSLQEKPLFPTHDNYETPNLIFGLPNFAQLSGQQEFFDAFNPGDDKGPGIHLYGHTMVNGNSYMHFIRGDGFYKKNKVKILKFFNEQLLNHIRSEDHEVIFISSENKHNSNFIEDISQEDCLKGKSITILRFDFSNEFIDNFISLHSKVIKSKNAKIIFFEEVMSAGKTFKLLSDYIKHSKDEPKITGRHGFDLVLTLVDRTLQFTKNEIIKKLSSHKNNERSQECFIAYFKLNVPIIDASHMGNPLRKKIEDLKKMIQECHLDVLKIYIEKKIRKKTSKNIHELEALSDLELNYFPFSKTQKNFDREIYSLYSPSFNKKSLDLLKLNLTHELNCELSLTEYQEKDYFDKVEIKTRFVDKIIKNIYEKIQPELEKYFIRPENRFSNLRDQNEEFSIIQDTIFHILTHHPFIYYKNIYEETFYFCLYNLDKFHLEIESQPITKFEIFRKLKFYIRRSIELNSNFILSKRFLLCLKNQYNKDIIENAKDHYKRKIRYLKSSNNENDKAYHESAINNCLFKLEQISTYFTFLLYCYKELVYKNSYRSIKLEELINSPDLLPPAILQPKNTEEELEKLVKDPYFHLTGMIKAENIYLLSELKELHKQNLKKKPFRNISNYIEYYFDKPTERDQTILNVQKFIGKSRFSHLKDGTERSSKIAEIKLSINSMLETLKLLESKKSRESGVRNSTNKKTDLNSEIREIFNSVLKIIQHGIPEGALKYSFFIEFKKKTGETKPSENIYAIISDENRDNPENVKLKQNGLICNLLYGLYDSKEFGNEQTLVLALRNKEDQFFSFTNKYYYRSLETNDLVESDFSDLYKNDFYNSKNGTGIKLLESANMCLAFRLSRFSNLNPNGSTRQLEGQAVLLITNSQVANTTNFLNFMSNEKVRLLLLIKEELLEYLEKQFDNDAFIEVIENRKKEIYQRHLRHGLNQYLTAQELLVERIQNAKNQDKNKRIFEIVTNAIRGQIKATKILNASKKTIINKQKFLEDIEQILESDVLGERQIQISEMDLSGLDFAVINIQPSIYDVIIPELIINMKKYCPRIGSKGISIEYNAVDNILIFKNLINPNFLQDYNHEGGGLKMCDDILQDVLKLPPLETSVTDHEHIIKLKF